MEIRPYQPEDFETTCDLVKEFFTENIGEFIPDSDDESVAETVKKHSANVIVMVEEGRVVGLLAGELIDNPFQKWQMFQEVIWFVSKKYRRHGVKLLKRLEEMCREIGVKHIVMVSVASPMMDKLDMMYNHMGYELLESHYIKGL